MREIWLIARYEYGRHVQRRSFLFMALGMPLLLAAIFGIIVLVSLRAEAEQRLGLVDQTGMFGNIDVTTLDVQRPIPMTVFPDEQAARAALNATQIDAYVVVPRDYLQTGTVRAVGQRRLSEQAQNQVRALLRQGLLAQTPPANRTRLADPDKLVLRTLDGSREIGASSAFLLFALPYGFALVFIFTTFTTSGYLLQALTEEKEGRVIELLATTLSPQQMMAGKILGLSGVGLTQVGIWLGLGIVSVLAFVRDYSWLTSVQLPWSLLGFSLLYFLLGYLLIAACYAIVGAAVPTPQEAQPLVAPISLLSFAPMMLLVVILSRPNGLLAVILSLIPFSAPMTMLMRLPLANIPPWQLAASLLILLGSVVGAIWLSARVMRLGMLRYGKRLSLRELLGAATATGGS